MMGFWCSLKKNTELMTTAEINQSLYRPLQNGNAYDSLFPSSRCSVTPLAKGNTKVAIQEMAKWAFKYQAHTEKLTEVLYDTNLVNFIDNIQYFLYNHIQYAIDGQNQNLKSPACAWETRKTGTDCKSYSIFASTILLNAGVKHYLRRIEQRHVPNAFTHVYVVIPLNQNQPKLRKNSRDNEDYIIIDGTIKNNDELDFVKKDDIFMEPSLQINGLASPMTANYGLGCDCNGMPTSMKMGMPISSSDSIMLENALDNFHAFLDLLETKGFTRQKTQQILDRVMSFIDAGVNPSLQQVFYYNNNGLGTAQGEDSEDSSFLNTIAGLIPSGFFGDTFGSVFANGFNLSCWNSTFTPSKVAQEVQQIHIPFFENQLQKASTAKSTRILEFVFNYLLRAVDISHAMYVDYLPNGANWRSCSRQAIDIYVGVMQGVKVQTDILLKRLTDQYDITVSTQTAPARFIYPAVETGHTEDFSWSEEQHGNATYRVIKFNENIEDSLNPNPALQDIKVTDPVVIDPSQPVNTNGALPFNGQNQNQLNAGFGTTGWLLLSAVAGTLLYQNRNKLFKKK